ncbi:MAG: 30S ribosomal protein S6 [Bacteroidia bacterium]
MPVIDVVNAYEVTFILPPTLSEKEYQTFVENFYAYLEKNQVMLVHSEIWGLRKLAYPIQKHTAGYYVYAEFRALGSFIAQFRRWIALQPLIIRHLIVKLDKYGIEFNQKRREKNKNSN